jgi:hypothetical protein
MRIRPFATALVAFATLLVGAAVAARPAVAASVSETLVFGPIAPNATSLLAFQTFDTSLGTLDAVEITLNADLSARVRVNNVDDVPLAWKSATGMIDVSATGPAGAVAQVALRIDDTTGGIIEPGGGYVGDFLPDSASDASLVAADDFGSYWSGIVPSTFDIVVAAGPYSVSLDGDDDLVFGGRASVSGSVTLTYFYTAPAAAVPEPGTLALLAAPAGLLGLAAAGRRLRNRRRPAA